MITTNKPPMIAYIAYIFVTLFLFFEMALQVSPSVITHQLMHDLQVDASWLGIISGTYFYSYMFMQIPAGLLLDRQSARIIIPAAILICVFGTGFFAVSHTVFTAALGRFLMGIGSAGAFISVLVVASRWFPASYFTVLVGIAMFLGAGGALGGTVPLAAFMNTLGWRHALYCLIVVGVILAILIWIILAREPKQTVVKHREALGIKQSLGIVFKSKQSWWIALYTFCNWAPMAVFTSLWGVPYLMSKYHISNTKAATGCAIIWIGFMFGSPLIGWLSDHTGKRLPFMRALSLLGFITTLLILYLPGLSYGLMMPVLLLLGVAATSQVLTFAVATEMHSKQITATVIAFNNMAAIAAAALLQPLVGIVLHLVWNGQVEGNIPVYSVENYQEALAFIPLGFLVSFIASQFFIVVKSQN